MSTIKRWSVRTKITVLAVVIAIVGGGFGVNALSADSFNPAPPASAENTGSGDSAVEGLVDPGSRAAAAQATPDVDLSPCEAFVEDGFSGDGEQLLAVLGNDDRFYRGTAVAGDNVEEAAQAHLDSIIDDIDKLGQAELVYRAVGIHASRILGSESEEIDVNRELTFLEDDGDLAQSVCEQILLEAYQAFETGELSTVTSDAHSTINILAHDEANKMLPAWICNVPVTDKVRDGDEDEGIKVLSFAQFTNAESGEDPEQVHYSLSQRAYITFGPCPDMDGARQFEDGISLNLDCLPNEEQVELECVEIPVEPIVCDDGETRVEFEVDGNVDIETCVPEAIIECDDGETEIVDADGKVTGCEPAAETPCDDGSEEKLDDDGNVACEDPNSTDGEGDGDGVEETPADTTCTSNCEDAPAPNEPADCTTNNTCTPTTSDPVPCGQTGTCPDVPSDPVPCEHTNTCPDIPSDPVPCEQTGTCPDTPTDPGPCVGDQCPGDKCPTIPGNQGSHAPCDTCEERGDCPPPPPPPPVCEDQGATNTGGPLPCEYPPPQVCEDPDATNTGHPLPCDYPPPPPPPPPCPNFPNEPTIPDGYSIDPDSGLCVKPGDGDPFGG